MERVFGVDAQLAGVGHRRVKPRIPTPRVLRTLLLCLACNLFGAFVGRNLKAQVRARHTVQTIARCIQGEFYQGLPAFWPPKTTARRPDQPGGVLRQAPCESPSHLHIPQLPESERDTAQIPELLGCPERA